ncbi:MAG: M23 family metallopeptidase [bacterium]|nr:M23 family metallopeptidase [bacterium]
MDPEQNPTEQPEQLPQPGRPQPQGPTMGQRAKGLGGNLINKASSAKTGGKIGGGKGEAAGRKTPLGSMGGGKKGPAEEKIDKAAGKAAGTGIKAALTATGVGATVAQAAGKATDWLVRKIGSKRLAMGLAVVILMPTILVAVLIATFFRNPLAFLYNVNKQAGIGAFSLPVNYAAAKIVFSSLVSENNKSTPKIKLADKIGANNPDKPNARLAASFKDPGVKEAFWAKSDSSNPEINIRTKGYDDKPYRFLDTTSGFDQRDRVYTHIGDGRGQVGKIKIDICNPSKGMLIDRDVPTDNPDPNSVILLNNIENSQLFIDRLKGQPDYREDLCPPGSEVRGGGGQAGAAGAEKPAIPDSLANTVNFKELLAKINWKEAQYQYGRKESLYTLKTSDDGKQVLAFVARDGKEIAPADVSNQSQEVQNAIADSMDKLIPIKEILIRGPQLRKINKASDVKLAYAAGEESKTFSDKDSEEAAKAEYDRTLGRVRDPKIQPIQFTESLSKDDEYNKIKEIIKNVEQQIKDGTPPQKIDISNQITLSDNPEAKAKTICYFYDVLLDPVNVKNSIENRANAARRNATKYLTYADTQLYRKVNPEETKAVFNQVADWASSTGYQNTVNGSTNKGEQADPDSRQQTGISVPLDEGIIATIYKKCRENKESHEGKFDFSPSLFTQIISWFGFSRGPSAESIDVNRAFSDLRKEIFDNSYQYYPNAGIPVASEMPENDTIVKSIYVASGGSVTGVEGGPQNFNRQSGGMRQLYNDYLQGMGGRFLTDEEEKNLQLAIESTKRYREKNMGIAYRLFSKENIRSTVSVIGSNFTLVRPATAMKRVASTIANLANPIQSLASMYDSISYYGFGENNTALASGSDQNYFKLSPIGFNIDKLNQTDLQQNADHIESLAKQDSYKEKFANWDKCMTEKITSPYYLIDEYLDATQKIEGKDVPVVPDDIKKLYKESCRPFMDPKQLDPEAENYRTYTAGVYIVKGLVNLNGEEKLDISDVSSFGGGTTGEFAWPTPGSVTSCFGPRASPGAGGSTNHKGLDIDLNNGDSVFAADGGTIESAGPGGGYGNLMVIDHGNGKKTKYAHLQSFVANIGDKVGQGQEIAKANSTGNSTGPHLHFEVIVEGQAVNPLKYLPNDGRSLGGCSADYEGQR